MAGHAYKTFGRQYHCRCADRVAAEMAPSAERLVITALHDMDVQRCAQCALPAPLNFSGLGISYHFNVVEMAGFAAHPEVNIMGHLCIVAWMALQAVAQCLISMFEGGGLWMTG